MHKASPCYVSEKSVLAYLDKDISIADVMTSHSFPKEALGANATAISLQEVFAYCSLETWGCLLALVNSFASIIAMPISPESPWACATLEVRIIELGTRDILVARMPIVGAGICITKSYME